MTKEKKCCHCGKTKPLDGGYFISKKTADGHWHWCIDCEKEARQQTDEMKYCLSFSGGKDSTAMLILALEKKIPLDKIIYFDCEEFEFPEMHNHIEKVKKILGVKIDVCHTVKPFRQYLKELGWATPSLRWCTNEKINSIRRVLRFYRPHTSYIGFASDETMRVERAFKKNKARTRDKFMHFSFPLVDWNVSEKEALKICYSYGFDWDGLYKEWDRLSCWCCPLQSDSDIDKLKRVSPDLWERLWELDELAPRDFKWGFYKNSMSDCKKNKACSIFNVNKLYGQQQRLKL